MEMPQGTEFTKLWLYFRSFPDRRDDARLFGKVPANGRIHGIDIDRLDHRGEPLDVGIRPAVEAQPQEFVDNVSDPLQLEGHIADREPLCLGKFFGRDPLRAETVMFFQNDSKDLLRSAVLRGGRNEERTELRFRDELRRDAVRLATSGPDTGHEPGGKIAAPENMVGKRQRILFSAPLARRPMTDYKCGLCEIGFIDKPNYRLRHPSRWRRDGHLADSRPVPERELLGAQGPQAPPIAIAADDTEASHG